RMARASMGRWMQILAIYGLLGSRAGLPRRVRRQPDFLAGAPPVASLDDDPLAGLQPLGHHPQRANSHVDLDLADVDRVVGADHGDLMNRSEERRVGKECGSSGGRAPER